MTERPIIDGRDQDEILEDLRNRAANYTSEWDPYSEDSGTTLMRQFARFESDVVKRLNGTPHKHRVAFLNALDFDRRPPQSARVPLTFFTAGDLDRNVVVPGGTQVTAEADAGDTVIFEIPQDAGFEATPASLTDIYSVAPGSNSIHEHGELLDAESEIRLFTGSNIQKHEFYLGHEDLLNLDAESTITLILETPHGDILEERVEWEYFGQNDEEELGWHPLPRETEDVVEDPLGEEFDLEEKMRRVSDQVQQLEKREEEVDENLHELAFRLPGQTEPTVVSGTESRWIRGRISGDEPTDFDIDIESARLDVEGGGEDEGESLPPEMALANDVPLSIDDGEFLPFGRMPQPPATLYLSSEEAFTKKGGGIDIHFTAPEEEDDEDDEDDEGGRTLAAAQAGRLAGPPEVSWQYWNGNGWTQLPLETDETEGFTTDGTVSFTIPENFDTTTVSGHEDYWIRARLVSGNYGQPQYEMRDDGTRGKLVQQPDPPTFTNVGIQYGHRNVQFENVITHNNVAYRVELRPGEEGLSPGQEEPLEPFVALPDEKQTLYMGFDATLREGPVNLYIPMEDQAYPRGFEPAIRWEYCENPASWSWKKLNVYDGTEGLTEGGIVSINFPDATEAFELFGKRRHWIRARVTRDEFVSDVSGLGARGSEDNGDRKVEHFDPGLPTEQDSKAPPSLEGVFPNTQWAYNERTVEERLGSSDGSPDQEFACDNAPITEAEVWVDEAEDLSETERRELAATRPDDVRSEGTDETGGTFWVRWEEVTDFLDSGEHSRHYRLNRANGKIRFGDGKRGAIPPTGDSNIEVLYQTGGGSEGNVDANSITDLRSSISRIDSVTNLKQADGGTDVESLDQAVERAPKRIKNRNRAVSADDFEQIAKDASRQLARVRCEPEMDDTGGRTPGWVTLLIIPRERRDRPTPSLELRQRVKQAVSERAPATLVGNDQNRIVVRGPDYAEVSVETTVDTKGVESITTLKNTIEDKLDEFFHPLTGSRDGNGWQFGRVPRLSQLSTLVESTDGVDRVRDITMTIETASEEKIIRDPEKTPLLSRDEMISSGTHEVNVIMKSER